MLEKKAALQIVQQAELRMLTLLITFRVFSALYPQLVLSVPLRDR
jgi:hypothetical protein